jgi:hypothetical protein
MLLAIVPATYTDGQTVIATAPYRTVRLAQGRHRAAVVAVDRAGNRSKAGTVAFTVS